MFMKIIPVALPLALGACQAAPYGTLPDAAVLAAAASPHQSVRMAMPTSVLTGYTHREPVDPKGWRQLNDGQSPGGASGS